MNSNDIISIIYLIVISIIAILLLIANIKQKAIIAFFRQERKEDYQQLKILSIHALSTMKKEFIAKEDYEKANEYELIIQRLKETII